MSDLSSKKKSKEAKDAPAKPSPESGSTTPKPIDDDGANDSAYAKELQKHIRNINKRLAATQKVDAIMAANPNLTLDELVATRKINSDQKAQALNKPATQAKLVQLEEQLTQYKKFEEEHQQRWLDEKRELASSHAAALEDARREARAETIAEADKSLRDRLLVLSKFLRAAAARRQMDEDNTEESKAFEGVLLLLYGGDGLAVDAAEKLIGGANEQVPSTDGEPLQVTYDRIKQMSVEYAPFAAEEAWVNDVAAADSTDALGSANGTGPMPVGTDPTVAHASLTEIEAERDGAPNGVPSTMPPPDKAEVDLGAANAAAASHWDKNADVTGSVGDDWVSIPRDAGETETPVPAQSSTAMWADEPPETATDASASIPPNDGFHEVHHGRSRGRVSGSMDRGGGRGRGYRDRGRGGFRSRGDGYPRGQSRGGRGGRGREAMQA